MCRPASFPDDHPTSHWVAVHMARSFACTSSTSLPIVTVAVAVAAIVMATLTARQTHSDSHFTKRVNGKT